MTAEGDFNRYSVEKLIAGGVARDQLLRRNARFVELRRAAERRDAAIGRHRLDMGKLLRDELELGVDIDALLIPVDQFLQRRRKIAVGADDGDELAHVDIALQGIVDRRWYRREMASAGPGGC